MKLFKKIIVFIGLFFFSNISPSLKENKIKLLDAAKKGQIKEVKELLKVVDINSSINEYGNTTLHVACQNKQTNLVTELINLGADVNVVNNNKDTALHFAVISSSKKIIVLLVTSSANINTQNKDGFSPLHVAIIHHDSGLIKYLLEHKADPNKKDYNGLTSFFWAVMSIAPETLSNLSKKQSYFNKKLSIINVCIDSQLVDINIQNNDKETVLMFFIQNHEVFFKKNGFTEKEVLSIFELLMKLDIDFSLKNNQEKNLFDVLEQEKKDYPSSIPFLEKLKKILDDKNKNSQNSIFNQKKSKEIFCEFAKKEEKERLAILQQKISEFLEFKVINNILSLEKKLIDSTAEIANLEKTSRFMITESKLKKLEKITRNLILLELQLATLQLFENIDRDHITAQSINELDTEYNKLQKETTNKIIVSQKQEEKNCLLKEKEERESLIESIDQKLTLFQEKQKLLLEYFQDLEKLDSEFKKEFNAITSKYPCPHHLSNFACSFTCNKLTVAHKKIS